MLIDDAQTILLRLEGFLKAFEWFNTKTNFGCNFSVYRIPIADDVPGALACFFNCPAAEFRLESLREVEQELRLVFAHFLFLFQEPVGGHKYGDYLVDRRKSFWLTNESGKQSLLNELAELVQSLGITASWRLRVGSECGALRECSQDDLVLAYPTGLCLLHFGFSD